MSGKISLLVTTDGLPIGGAERGLELQLRLLDRELFHVHLMTFRKYGALLLEGINSADRYCLLGRRFGFDLTAIYRLRRYIANNKIDIVHCHLWLDSVYVALATIGMKVKRVVTIHGYTYNWRDWLWHYAIKRMHKVVCISRSQQLEVYKHERIPLDSIAVIHNVHDDFRFYPIRPTRKYENGKVPFKIVMVGRITWEKDQCTLVRATHILEERGLNVQLDLIGINSDFKARERLDRCIDAAGVNGNVRILDNIVADASVLSKYDLFVFSSFSETFGLALIEAMVCGLPVLVSDIPSLMELILYGEYGSFFITGDETSCANAVERYILSPEMCNGMSAKAMERASHFKKDSVKKAFESLYRKMLCDSEE